MSRALLSAVLIGCLSCGGARADWMNSDVPVGLIPAGTAMEDPAGTWTVEGAGVDIWGVSDEFHYLYEDEPLAGDFAVGCHVISLSGTPNAWGKAGIMARTGVPEFLGPESYAFVCATTANGVCLQWRDGDGLDAAWQAPDTQFLGGPEDVWIKLVRRGDEFFGYVAEQRPLWRSLSSHFYTSLLGLEEVYVGLAVTSHEDGTLAEAVFDEIDLEDPGISEAGPSGLICEVDGGEVTLEWTNNSTYDEVVLFRKDLAGQLTRLSPGPSPDDSSYVDSPGDGIWEYWISAVDGGMECVATGCAGVAVGDLGYAGAVLADGPAAYWRLGELEGTTAFNIGTAGTSLHSTYTGGYFLGEDSLLPNGQDLSVLFDGLSAEVQIPDSNAINNGGPHQTRSIELWFQADLITTIPSMLFEEGGNTRGLNIYVLELNGEPSLVMNAWNQAQEAWGPLYVSTPIVAGEVYHAVMVLDADQNGAFGDFDGRITGYLDGEEFETISGVDQLYAHGDDCAIGGIHTNTRFHDDTTQGDGGNFTGPIDEVAVYNLLLDDPDNDGDRSDSRVEAHFEAGGSGGPPPEPTFRRGDSDSNGGAPNITDGIYILNFLFLGGPSPTCMDAADADDNGDVNITDGIYVLNFLFLGGPAPPPPADGCGEDPTGDAVGCQSFPPCS